MNISQLKIQPEHFQGKLMKMSFNCPQKRCIYFKVQGKSVNLGKNIFFHQVIRMYSNSMKQHKLFANYFLLSSLTVMFSYRYVLKL